MPAGCAVAASQRFGVRGGLHLERRQRRLERRRQLDRLQRCVAGLVRDEPRSRRHFVLAAGALSGNVYRVDIASGAVLGAFNSGPGGVSGLAVYDELFDQVADGVFADGFEAPAAANPSAARVHPVGADCVETGTDADHALLHYRTLAWVADFTTPRCAD